MLTPRQVVVVVSANHGNAMVHCGPPAKQQLLLLAHDAHYDVITKLNAYFGVFLVCNADKATRPRTFFIIVVLASNVTVASRPIP